MTVSILYFRFVIVFAVFAYRYEYIVLISYFVTYFEYGNRKFDAARSMSQKYEKNTKNTTIGAFSKKLENGLIF